MKPYFMEPFKEMKEFRCPKCGKLFFRYKLQGICSVEIRCARCKERTEDYLEENI